MDLDFYKEGHLSQKTCQKLLDMTRHLHFAPKDIRSEHLLRRLELPCAETAMHTYDLLKEGDGNQRLESVVRDNLEFFQGLMQSPKWKDIFDLMFREIFDAVDGRWIGPVLRHVGAHTEKNFALRCFWCNTALFRRNLSDTESGDRYRIQSVDELGAGRSVPAQFTHSSHIHTSISHLL